MLGLAAEDDLDLVEDPVQPVLDILASEAQHHVVVAGDEVVRHVVVLLKRALGVIAPAVNLNSYPEEAPQEVQLCGGPTLIVTEHLVAFEAGHPSAPQSSGYPPFCDAAVPVAQLVETKPHGSRPIASSTQSGVHILRPKSPPQQLFENWCHAAGG